MQQGAIRLAATRAKEALSTRSSVRVALKDLRVGLSDCTLAQAELETQFRPMLAEAQQYLMFTLRAASMRDQNFRETQQPGDEQLRSNVDCLLLTGGSAKIPLVYEEMQRLFRGRVEVLGDSRSLGSIGPQEVVVAGLVHDPAAFGHLNLHRPSFDVWLEWQQRGEEPQSMRLYRAYTPLYGLSDIAISKWAWGYEESHVLPTGPAIDWCRLSLRTIDGQTIPLRIRWEAIEGRPALPAEELEALPLRGGSGSKVRMKLYVDGRIHVWVNGAQWQYRGYEGVLYVRSWPMIRSGNFPRKPIELTTKPPRHMYDPDYIFD